MISPKLKLIAIIGLVNIAASDAVIIPTQSLFPPLKQTATLEVNVSTSYRTFTRKSEEKGVRDIRYLVDKSELEEAWAYLPDRHFWIETGKSSFSSKEVMRNGKPEYNLGVYGYDDHIKKLMQTHDNLVFYHFHPKNGEAIRDRNERATAAVAAVLRKKGFEPSQELLREESLYMEKEFYAEEARPSGGDLLGLISNSNYFFAAHPNGRLSHKIVSSFGVTEFNLTQDGVKFFRDKNYEFIRQYSNNTSRYERIPFLNSEILNDKSKTIASIKEFLNSASDNNIKITFNPYSP